MPARLIYPESVCYILEELDDLHRRHGTYPRTIGYRYCCELRLHIWAVIDNSDLISRVQSNIPLSGVSTQGSIYESFSRCGESIDDSKYNEYLM